MGAMRRSRPSSADWRASSTSDGRPSAWAWRLRSTSPSRPRPTTPWVRDHPEWFRHAPDGSIRYAENPPKRYQDVYPFDFRGPDHRARAALWEAWRELVLTWVERGVRIFRVDNPHTKPVAFWAWLIREVQARYPDVIFLAEAFTRHKPMRLHSKAGFTQSYTYFTWRTDAKALRKYFIELTETEMRQYYRGNLFTNTPDINPHYLARGRSTFVSRLVLAATLSGLYGIYSGFELLEHRRIGRTEEYKDSEKYEIVVRDWDAPGNLNPLIAQLNGLRRASWPALQRTETLRFEAVRGQADPVLSQGAARSAGWTCCPRSRSAGASRSGSRSTSTPPGRSRRSSARTWPRWGSIRSVRIGTWTC